MGDNLELFGPAIYRRTDPETSKLAGDAHDRGRRQHDQGLLLALICAQPDRTAMEYADVLIRRGMSWFKAYQVANKRASDLERLGSIQSIGTRRCEITGKQARVWRAA